MDGNFLNSFLSSSNLEGSFYPYFDILDMHYYPDVDGITNGDFSDLLSRGDNAQFFTSTMQPHSVSKPIIITEMGSASGPDSDSNGTNQAERLVKYYVYSFSRGVKSISWFFGWDSSMTPNWGILKQAAPGFTPTKKTSFFSYKSLSQKLSGFASVEKISEGKIGNFTEGVYKFNFSERNPIYVGWSESNKILDLSPYISTPNVLVTDIIGGAQTKETIKVPISKSPVFIEAM